MDKAPPSYRYESFEYNTPGYDKIGPSPPQYDGEITRPHPTNEDCTKNDRDGEESKPHGEDDYCSKDDADSKQFMPYHEDKEEHKSLVALTFSAGSTLSNEFPGDADLSAGHDQLASERNIKLALPKKRKANLAKQAKKACKKASQLFRSGTNLCRQMSKTKPTVKRVENFLEECSEAVIPHPRSTVSLDIHSLKGQKRKPETITIFHIFEKLSVELRDMIWETAIKSDPQVREIWSERRQATSSVQEYFTAIPVFCHVSIEARAAACRVYGVECTRRRFQYLTRQIFVRPGLDSILIVNHEKSWGWLEDAPRFRRDHIQSLAITDTAFGHSFLARHLQRPKKATLDAVKTCLPKLQEIIILPGGIHTGIFNLRYFGIKDNPNNLRDRSWRLEHSGTPTPPLSFTRKDVCKHKIFNHWVLQFFNSDDGSSGKVHLNANWYWFARDMVYRVRQYGEVRIVRGIVQDGKIYVRERGVCETPRFKRCCSNNYSTLAKKTERGVCRLLGMSPPPWGAP